jgi:hypothetical protein
MSWVCCLYAQVVAAAHQADNDLKMVAHTDLKVFGTRCFVECDRILRVLVTAEEAAEVVPGTRSLIFSRFRDVVAV